ncbi:MAG: hypothetical protein GF317_00095, partial [Candidatus Lokiarchaeota archaeon]|nr:hypothetical protein [Candidatus Lokiarchaeota archaeon]MBD3198386.1 hypothetical protein [Candidatus Lokiarchaeota archaeon]
MTNKKLDLIEKKLKSKKIEEYEIFLVERNIFETQLRKTEIDSERDVNDFEYIIRILNQNEDSTGIGLVKGNSLSESNLDRSIDTCTKLSKLNLGPKYVFPEVTSYPNIKVAEDDILKDPVSIKKNKINTLISATAKLKETKLTFGRFRVHVHKQFLRNCKELDLNSIKTFFYMEFALKAKENDKLSEFWDVDYIKSQSDLKLKDRVQKWSKFAIDALHAKKPDSKKNAAVIFSPNLLSDALNPVLGFHCSGQAHFEKTSSIEIGKAIAGDQISLFDDGLLEGGLKSDNWDGEGNPHQKTPLIEDGIFKNRIYDQKYALLEEKKSTGNGIRTDNGSINNTITNFYIPPGNNNLEDIIHDLKEGYLIQKCSWLNPDNYSGSFGAEIRYGYYIKDGEIKLPIKGGNLSGNVLAMLQNIIAVSQEQEFSGNSLFPYIAFK